MSRGAIRVSPCPAAPPRNAGSRRPPSRHRQASAPWRRRSPSRVGPDGRPRSRPELRAWPWRRGSRRRGPARAGRPGGGGGGGFPGAVDGAGPPAGRENAWGRARHAVPPAAERAGAAGGDRQGLLQCLAGDEAPARVAAVAPRLGPGDGGGARLLPRQAKQRDQCQSGEAARDHRGLRRFCGEPSPTATGPHQRFGAPAPPPASIPHQPRCAPVGAVTPRDRCCPRPPRRSSPHRPRRRGSPPPPAADRRDCRPPPRRRP